MVTIQDKLAWEFHEFATRPSEVPRIASFPLRDVARELAKIGDEQVGRQEKDSDDNVATGESVLLTNMLRTNLIEGTEVNECGHKQSICIQINELGTEREYNFNC